MKSAVPRVLSGLTQNQKERDTWPTLGCGGSAHSVGASYNYQASRFDWSATVGVGIGSNQAGGGMGLSVGYGSQGIIWGVGGWGRGPVNAMADKRAAQKIAAKTKTESNTVTGQQTIIFEGDDLSGREKIKAYLQSVGTKNQADIAADLESIGFKKIPTKDTYNGMKYRRGDIIIRLEPPQLPGTPYNHMHGTYGNDRNTYDQNMNRVPFKSKAAHWKTL